MRARVMKVFSVLAVTLAAPMALGAQTMGEAIASQNLRGYTHMFIAYAIAWVVISGWVISIARRLGRIEKALNK